MKIPVVYTLLVVLFFCCSGCSNNESTVDDSATFSLQDIPVTTPEEIIRFDSSGDTYFRSLGLMSTVALPDGNFLLLESSQNKLLKIDRTGDLLETVASQGEGPGEFLHIPFMSQSVFGDILVYDQGNRKVIVMDSLGHYKDEFLIGPWNALNLSEIYEMERQKYMMVFPSYFYIHNSVDVPELYFTVYNRLEDSFSDSVRFLDRIHAKMIIGGMTAGFRFVPYAVDQLRAYDRTTGEMYQFWTEKDQIAQFGINIDTLRTIKVPIQPERLEEDDEIIHQEQLVAFSWADMEPLLAEYKARANRMLIDHNSNFWLQLNHSSDFQQWLVLSREGSPLRMIHLPKEGRLTHISEFHLGFRVDNATFALYGPVSLNQ